VWFGPSVSIYLVGRRARIQTLVTPQKKQIKKSVQDKLDTLENNKTVMKKLNIWRNKENVNILADTIIVKIEKFK
jgi:hypothetical protein